MRQHFRVHSHIFASLVNRAEGISPRPHKANAAFQTAFCYKTGFGTPADEPASLYWLKEAQRCRQDLDKDICMAKETMIKAYYRNGVLQNLSSESLLPEIKSSVQYNQDELQKAEVDYSRVIQDTERAFGQWNCCVIELKLKRTSILEAARKFKEAEVLHIRLLRDLATDPGRSELLLPLKTRKPHLQIELWR